MAQPILSVKKLKKSFGDFDAVNGISFDVQPGEIFALIGPNGAGKSTTLRMLSTLLTPTGGTVTLAGHDLKTEPEAIRQAISYLPEEAGAYKNLKGIDYLRFMATLYADTKQQEQEYIQFARQVTELGNRLNDKISEYSKGMTRKLLLARTVMTRPKLAILDEPTSGLDILNAVEIRKIIKTLAKEGMSVLLSSHNMLEIEFLSDRVGIIHKGKLLALGKPADLKKEHAVDNLEELFVKLVGQS